MTALIFNALRDVLFMIYFTKYYTLHHFGDVNKPQPLWPLHPHHKHHTTHILTHTTHKHYYYYYIRGLKQSLVAAKTLQKTKIEETI